MKHVLSEGPKVDFLNKRQLIYVDLEALTRLFHLNEALIHTEGEQVKVLRDHDVCLACPSHVS